MPLPIRLPRRLHRWWNLAIMAEHQHGVHHLLILAVLDKETLGGEALRPKGPTGSGDWTPRPWTRYQERDDAKRYRHWQPTREEYERLTRKKLMAIPVPELCMPGDGLGWGRGLMQIDYADPNNFPFLAELMEDGAFAWQNAWRNIAYGTELLAKRIQLFEGDEGLGVAAYNAGPGRIQRAISQLSHPASPEGRLSAADACTTGKNYASDVMGRRRHFQSLLLGAEDV